jgi:murein DD-endopeptidase MepM/ murein hydrolase activator NlpD
MTDFLNRLASALNRHPKRVIGALGVLLLGTGVTAFGIAPLAPDAADLPVSMVVEAIEPTPGATGPFTGAAPFVLFRSEYTRRDDNTNSLLQRLGVNDSNAAAFLRSSPQTKPLFNGRAGKLVSVETNGQHRLQRLTARWLVDGANQYNRLTITPNDRGGYTADTTTGDLTRSVRLGSGTIRTSLFAATDDALLPDSIAGQLAEVFSGDIDFRRDLRAGDRFSVVYETLEADGEVLKFGKLLSAEFQNNGKSHQLLWFQEPGQKGGYYGFDGKSQRRAFLASPLAFSRVSSGYGMRFHPVSGDRKAHLGVDFAVPSGTAVRSVADGVVTFAGWQNGYGNVIHVQHNSQKSTAYAHLSRILVRKGQKVGQGDEIGAVGSTGVSTGPHLHFEYRENGAHKDPLTIARQAEGQPVSAQAKAAFQQTAQQMRSQLSLAASTVQASAQ